MIHGKVMADTCSLAALISCYAIIVAICKYLGAGLVVYCFGFLVFKFLQVWFNFGSVRTHFCPTCLATLSCHSVTFCCKL